MQRYTLQKVGLKQMNHENISDTTHKIANDFCAALTASELGYDTSLITVERIEPENSSAYDSISIDIPKSSFDDGRKQTLFRIAGKKTVWVSFPPFICSILEAAQISVNYTASRWGRIEANNFLSFADYPELAQSIFEATIRGNGFGCCSRYEECSDAKHCTHPDIMIASRCAYRQNLHSGKIFYGKNRNV